MKDTANMIEYMFESYTTTEHALLRCWTYRWFLSFVVYIYQIICFTFIIEKYHILSLLFQTFCSLEKISTLYKMNFVFFKFSFEMCSGIHSNVLTLLYRYRIVYCINSACMSLLTHKGFFLFFVIFPLLQ